MAQEWAANYWVSKGCPKSKLVIGMATYGRSYRLSKANNNGMGAAASGPADRGAFTRQPGVYAYYEVSYWYCVSIPPISRGRSMTSPKRSLETHKITIEVNKTPTCTRVEIISNLQLHVRLYMHMQFCIHIGRLGIDK